MTKVPTFGKTAVCKHSGFAHSFKVDWVDLQGFWGHPVILTAGGSYKLSKASSVLWSVQASKYYQAHIKFAHKLDKNWKVAAH